MKRWLLLRARADLNPIVRPGGKGVIGQTPVWVDTLESPDFYSKYVRKGLLIVLSEADERPRPEPAPEPPQIEETDPPEDDPEEDDEEIEDLEEPD